MSGPRNPSSFEHGLEFPDETVWQKIGRRLKEEPLIPIGFAATCYALYHASLSMRAGDRYRTNRMFRYRIYGQAFTLIAIVAGSYYYNADRLLRKEYEAIKAEQKAKEKNEAWIKELEFRDQEEKERQNKNNKVRERQRKLPPREEDDSEEKSIGSILEATQKSKLVQELKKAAHDTAEVVKDVVDTKKEE